MVYVRFVFTPHGPIFTPIFTPIFVFAPIFNLILHQYYRACGLLVGLLWYCCIKHDGFCIKNDEFSIFDQVASPRYLR